MASNYTPIQKKHKHYESALRAHYGTSFSPEKRAASECEYFDAIVSEFVAEGKESAIEKFEQLFLKSLSAKSRCVSSMISGPANFPVARMQKYNQWERRASDAMLAFVEKVRRPCVSGPARTELDYKIEANEYEICGVRVLHNVEQNRLQLFFNVKPESEMIIKLKSRGFKWSPRNAAWQRQLTPNAICALPYIFPNNKDSKLTKARGEA